MGNGPRQWGAILTRYHGVCSTGTNEFTAQSARSQIMVTGLTNDTPLYLHLIGRKPRWRQ